MTRRPLRLAPAKVKRRDPEQRFFRRVDQRSRGALGMGSGFDLKPPGLPSLAAGCPDDHAGRRAEAVARRRESLPRRLHKMRTVTRLSLPAPEGPHIRPPRARARRGDLRTSGEAPLRRTQRQCGLVGSPHHRGVRAVCSGRDAPERGRWSSRRSTLAARRRRAPRGAGLRSSLRSGSSVAGAIQPAACATRHQSSAGIDGGQPRLVIVGRAQVVGAVV